MQDFTTIWPFLSPTIKKIAFVSYEDAHDNAFSRVLQRLMDDSTSPNFSLTHLRLEFGLNSLVRAEPEVARFLDQQVDLELLYIHRLPITERALSTIGRLNKLREAQVTFCPASICDFHIVFCHLGKASSLRSLKLTLNGASRDDKTPLSFDHLRPLLRLHSLVKLEIVCPMGILLEPSDIHEMGQAYPLLETLHFPHGSNPNLSSQISILVEIGRSFGPTLTDLSLQVSCREIPINNDPPMRIPSLQTLRLINSDLMEKDVQAVAELLSRLCSPTVVFRCDDWREWAEPARTPVWPQVEAAIRGHHELWAENPAAT